MADISRRTFHKSAVGALIATAGPAALTLGSASTASAATSTAVVPINASLLKTPTDAIATQTVAVLRNTNQFAVTTWWNTTKAYAAQTGTYLDFGGTAENNIRPPAAQSFGLATALKTGVYSATQTGVSVATATAMTTKMVSSLAYRHLVNFGTGGWGDGWQTAHWAAFAGTAGWLLWDKLSAGDAELVRKMVEYEANRFLSYPYPEYYRAVDGTYLIPGDTKAEEIAWNNQCVALAASMMPNHPNYAKWMHLVASLSLKANSTPVDVGANAYKVINGMKLGTELAGSNVNQDFTVVNHNIIHPDYMVAFLINLSGGLTLALANQTVPYAMRRGYNNCYAALIDLNFTPGPVTYTDPNLAGKSIATPGGKIYASTGTSTTDPSDIYYPMGNDWGTERRMHFAAMDVVADSFKEDDLASIKAATWAKAHLTKVQLMQERSTDRRTYIAAGEDTYPGREEWVSNHVAWAYLARVLSYSGLYRVSSLTTVY